MFAASAFRKLSSIYVFSYFPFGFEGRIWDLIVSVPDHCLSFYFVAIDHRSCFCISRFGYCVYLSIIAIIYLVTEVAGLFAGRLLVQPHLHIMTFRNFVHPSDAS